MGGELAAGEFTQHASLDGPQREALQRTIDDAIVARAQSGTLPVPPFPSVALRLQQLIANDAATAELVKVVGVDQALAADVLRVANAATYGNGRAVTSLPDAIQRLGTKKLGQVCFGSSLSQRVSAEGVLLSLRRRVWQEAVLCALVCEELAMARALPTAPAYLAGLLHDFGKVIVLACGEELVQRDATRAGLDDESWMGIAERHHAEVGFLLAEQWRLPEPLPALILGHHGLPHGGDAKELHELLALGDRLVDFVAKHPFISVDALQELEGIRSRGEAEKVVRALMRMPPLVSAMCTPEPPRFHPPEPEAPPALLEAGARVAWPTKVLTRSIDRVVTTEIAHDALVLSSPVALAESWVAHVELDTGGAPCKLWINVRRCRRETTGFRIEAVPFAMQAEARQQWGALLRSALEASSGAAATNAA